MDQSAAASPAEADHEHLRAAALQARLSAAWAEDAAAAFTELRLSASVESAAGPIVADLADQFAAELRSFWRTTSATLKDAVVAERDQGA